jgi:hypothetical protein
LVIYLGRRSVNDAVLYITCLYTTNMPADNDSTSDHEGSKDYI